MARVIEQKELLGSAVDIAPWLIGKLLCREVDGEIVRKRIVETECYFGEEDTACHAHKGRTERTEIMYREGGNAYVYLCYGIHSLLNITTGPEGHPEAVLIRGVEGIIGPGRLTKAMKIDRSLNKLPLIRESGLWIEDDGYMSNYTISKRVGIDYALPKDRDIPWRFLMLGNDG